MHKNGARALWVVLGIALALRFWSLGWGLPLIQHAGELAALKKPLGLAGPAGIKPFGVWSVPFDLHFFVGKLAGLFSDYIAYQKAFLSDPSNTALIGRASAALFSAGVCLLLLETGKVLGSRKAGLGAALLWAVSPLAVREAHLALPVNFSIFFTLLSLYFVIRLKDRFDPRWSTAAGLCAGFATVTAPAPIFVLMTLLSALILLMLILIFRGKESLANFGRPFLFALGGGLAGLLLGCTLIVICPPCLFKTSVFGPPTEITNPLLYYPWAALHVLDRATIGFLLAGGLFAVVKKNASGMGLLGFGLLGYGILLFNQPPFGGRPHFEAILFVLPTLLLAAALGLESLIERTVHSERMKGIAFATLVIITAVLPFSQSVIFNQVLRAPSTVALAREWASKNIPGGSRIAVLSNSSFSFESDHDVSPIDLCLNGDLEHDLIRANRIEWVVMASDGLVLESSTRPIQRASSRWLVDYLEENATRVYAIAPCLERDDENFFGGCPERGHFNYVLPLQGLMRVVRPGPAVAVYRINEARGAL